MGVGAGVSVGVGVGVFVRVAVGVKVLVEFGMIELAGLGVGVDSCSTDTGTCVSVKVVGERTAVEDSRVTDHTLMEPAASRVPITTNAIAMGNANQPRGCPIGGATGCTFPQYAQ